MSGAATTPPPKGSVADMLARLKAVLPTKWFPDSTPVLDGLLTGLATTATNLHAMLSYVRAQARVATVTDTFVDLAAVDYCGARVRRGPNESDANLRARVTREMARTRATRQAVINALSDVTGRTPAIFEPRRAADTGAYGAGCGYGVAGGWGSLSMPFQCLVVAYRPFQPGAPAWTGGAGPGAPANGTPLVPLPLEDSAIYAAVAQVTPVAMIAWTALEN